jgi:3-hydroxyisobutyrate dehydrogenase-like beta-hydroxyacid dehydrogenase
MNADKSPVGVIGLGIMGGAIARNLRAKGRRVIGFDTDSARNQELARDEIEIAAGPAEVAAKVPVILTSLPVASALHATASAIADAGMKRRVVAELSTFALADKEGAREALHKGGHVLLDCPLSGTGAQAKVGDLVVYASGETPEIAALMPVFRDFARDAHDLGAFGNGTKMKLVANLLVAIHNVASGEAFALGIAAGLDPTQIYKLVKTGAGNSRVFELRGPLMAKDRYDDPTMKLAVWQKDMNVIGAFAASLGCRTPLFDATRPIYDAAIRQGLGGEDTAAVCRILESMAGIARRPSGTGPPES